MKFDETQTSSVQRSRMRSTLRVARLKQFNRSKVEIVTADSAEGVNDVYLKDLLASGKVKYAEENQELFAFATPNDPSFSTLWGMHNTGQSGGTADVDIDAPEAWEINRGTGNVVVGVIDTGVNYSHPDLAANIWVNSGEVAGNNIDDDGNGIIDDIHGANFVSDNGNPMDDNGHGSHCSGTIGGVGNNGVGVAGVNWNVKIMGLKFLDNNGSGYTSDAIGAIEYAIAMKQRGVNIKVLSNSWGGGGYSQALKDAISAANTAGILFVAAAGNSAANNDVTPSYPASYDVANVISVAAIDRNGNLASFSNYGASAVDIAAPGVSILSTVLGSSYASYQGTSMATPHVAGVAALVASNEGSLSVSALRTRILTTIKPLATLNGVVAYPGVVDAFNALLASQTVTPPPDPITYYQKATSSYAWDSDLGTRVLTVDDGYSRQNLPFSFDFYGTSYNAIDISANGRVIPLASGSGATTASDYAAALRTGINIFNMDLYPSPYTNGGVQGGVYYKADANGATISWVSVPYGYRASGNTANEVRLQLKISNNGQLDLHFGDTEIGDVSYDYGAGQAIGLGAPNGYISANVTTSVANAAEVGSQKALLFTTASNPDPQDDDNDPLLAAPINDVDGDGNTDLSVYNQWTGKVTMRTSTTGYAGTVDFTIPKNQAVFGADMEGRGRRDSVVAYDARKNIVSIYKASTAFTKATTIKPWNRNLSLVACGDIDQDGKGDLVFANKGYGLTILKSRGGFDLKKAKKGAAAQVLNIPIGGAINRVFVADTAGIGSNRIVAFMKDGSWLEYYGGNGSLVSASFWGQANDTSALIDWSNTGKLDHVAVRNVGSVMSWLAISSANGATSSHDFGPAGSFPLRYGFKLNNVMLMGFVDANGWAWFEDKNGENRLIYRYGQPGDMPF